MAEVLPETTTSIGLDENEMLICAALVERGRLKETDLNRAKRLHEESGGNLVSLLTRLGLASERDVAEAIAVVMNLPVKSSKDAPEAPPENVQLPLRFLKQHHVVPIRRRTIPSAPLLWPPVSASKLLSVCARKSTI